MKDALADKYKEINANDVASDTCFSYVLHDSNILTISKTDQNISINNQDNSIKIINSTEICIPTNVFRNNSGLEAVVYYLKEKLFLRYSEIARLLNRDQRTIWNSYNKSKNRVIITLSNNAIASDEINIPIKIFYTRNLSVLESVVFYLKSNTGLNFTQISQIIGKNYRTIWTVYARALKKIAKGYENN